MDIADIVFDTEMTDDCLFTDDEFTKICDNREQYLQLSEVEQETARRWAEIKHYGTTTRYLRISYTTV